MNLSTQQIESALRSAPRSTPPSNLKDKMIAQIKLPPGSHQANISATPYPPNWLRRWWTVLTPATASMICMAVFAVQQIEIHDLRKAVQSLPQPPAPEMKPAPETIRVNETTAPLNIEDAESEEINRLKGRVVELSAEIARLERFRTANAALRQQLVTASGLTAQEMEGLAKSRDRTMSIVCVNNLKQFGLGVRIWENDNGGVTPPDILTLSNQLNTPKVLVCPADTNRVVASNWASFTGANCSYEYLTPSITNSGSFGAMRVLSRCPVHGHIGLVDGSVHMEVAAKHPEWLVERDGKIYYERAAAKANP